MRTLFYFLCFMLALSFLSAQIPANADPTSADAAAKAAQRDAIQKLGDVVQNVRISNSLTVRDVVQTDPQVRGEFGSFLQGANQVGNTVYRLDGICEVTVETNLDAISYWLRTMTYKYATTYDRRTVDEMDQFNRSKIFRAVGTSQYKINSQWNNRPVTPPTPPPSGNWPTHPNNVPSTIPQPPVIPSPQPPRPPVPPIPQPPVPPIPQPPVNPIPQPPTTPSTIPPPPVAPTWEQPDFWSRVTPEGKSMARRAAQIDAYRNLGETLQGVQIDSNTRVKDFVTLSDEIRADFQGIVRGAYFISEQYRPDGVVEVTAQIDMNQFIKQLQRIARKQHNPRWNRSRFEGIRQYYQYPLITATGNGTPPNSMIRYSNNTIPPPPIAIPENPEMFNIVPVPPSPDTIRVPEWVHQSVKLTGICNYPPGMTVAQAKVVAREAAEIEAYRRLMDYVYALRLDAQTTVQDFLITHPTTDQEVRDVIGRSQITQQRDVGDGVEVDVDLQLEKIWQAIEPEYRSNEQEPNDDDEPDVEEYYE